MKKIFTFLLLFGLILKISAQTTLPTFWSFVNPSPSEDSTLAPNGWKTRLNISISGTTPYSYASGSDGNAACRFDGSGEYVQIAFAEKPGILSYYIRGTGISAPYFTGTFKVQESINGNTWTDLRSFTSMTSGFTKFLDNPASVSRYIRFFYTDKQSGSNVALDSVYLVKPIASSTATINVRQNGKSLANGSTFVIGTNATTIFNIKNGGTSQTLTIGSIAISGVNASDYTISNAPDSIVANDSVNFTIHFSPANQGSRFAKITINNNDTDNAAFEINLYGIGGSFATQPSGQPTSMSFTNLKAYTFNVNYIDPTAKPENYLVLRKTGSAITDFPVDGNTYLKGDHLGGSVVAYIGSANSFKPANILAYTSYHFAVFSFNGPPGFENYLTVNPLVGNIISGGANPGNYYNGISPTVSNLITLLHQKINTHDTIFYGNYTATLINEFIARDTTAGRKVVNCVYTSIPYIYNEPFLWWGNTSGGALTREHTFAQSWMPSNQGNPNWPNAPGGTKELPEYSDQHHIFPANQLQGNNVRSNHPFGEVVTITSQNGSGKLGLNAKGSTVYEPRNEQKGDLARALFYMCVAYHGVAGNNWSLGAISAAIQKDSVLKKWNAQDPPDAFEIARHEYVNSIQHNRNPFIDHPDWVNKINFNNLTYINGDTSPIKYPSVILLEPKAGSVWEKSKTVKVKWISVDVDSVFLFFSSDSLKTRENIGSAIAANKDSFSFVYSQSLKSQKGIVIIMDPISGKGDTSEYFNLVGSSSLYETRSSEQISVYPNPVTDGHVNIYVNTPGEECQLILMNLLGIKLAQLNFKNAIALDLSSCSAGVYYLHLANKSEYKTVKLIIE